MQEIQDHCPKTQKQGFETGRDVRRTGMGVRVLVVGSSPYLRLRCHLGEGVNLRLGTRKLPLICQHYALARKIRDSSGLAVQPTVLDILTSLFLRLGGFYRIYIVSRPP